MTKIKTADLTGPVLDWAVAQAAGYKPRVYSTQSIRAELPTGGVIAPFMPGFRWDQGGPIIEREWICVDRLFNGQWCAAKRTLNDDDAMRHRTNGPTPLIAAMRCFVASRLGDEVDVPDELTGDDKMTFKPGDTVALKQAVLRRTDHMGASARGTVVSVHDRIVRVDWHGTWIAHEDGSTVRSMPVANLTRVLTNGAVFGD